MPYPLNPTTGDEYILGSKTWKYNGSRWVKLGLSQTVSADVAFSDLTSKPSTLAGYGITDGATSASVGTVLSSTAPASPSNGSTWFDGTSGGSFVYSIDAGAWISDIRSLSVSGDAEGSAHVTTLTAANGATQGALMFLNQYSYTYDSDGNKWNNTGLSPTWISSWSSNISLTNPATYIKLAGGAGHGSSNLSGTYTPPATCTKFHVMLWGASGCSGNTNAYSNLSVYSTVSGTGGRAYSEHKFTNNGSTYTYLLSRAGHHVATGGAGAPSSTATPTTTTFTDGTTTLYCYPSSNGSTTGGTASGGTFNANGGNGVGGAGGGGGGPGSRTGPGTNASGSTFGGYAGTTEAAGVVPLETIDNFKGFTYPHPNNNGHPQYGSNTSGSSYESNFISSTNSPSRPSDYGAQGGSTGVEASMIIIEYYS